MISVFCLEWLRYKWFFISLFMDFDSLYCSVTSSLTLWAFSYILLMLTWIVKLLLCSLDSCSMYYNCSILYLASCVAWFVRRFMSQCLGYDPYLFYHGVHLQCRCDIQLVGFYPCFEMSCYGGLYFSCCGWWVGFACDRWWLFSLLCLLCLGHMCIDSLCCFSGLCVSWGLYKLIWSSGGVGVFG
jgi:hypothetical protein